MLTPRFDEAVAFSRELHAMQQRKGAPVPYLSHLLAVASLVLEDGGSEDETIAALLHDAIEDQGDCYPGGRPALRREIAGRFGDRVLYIVDACTDDDAFDKCARETFAAEVTAWRDRKQAYLEHLERTSDAGVLRVACADKVHNARSILADYRWFGRQLWDRFRTRDPQDQLWYYIELARIFSARPGRLQQELSHAVDQIRRAVQRESV
jgi:GTP pyrophosphokinase